MAPGLLIAASASGCGKTTVTLGLLRHLRDAGCAVSSIKVGPDYIDPAFHAAASGRACLNLDGWAMRPATLARLVARAGEGADLVLGEGVMGLFDGAAGGGGSTADLAALTGWPVVLVLDVRGQGASAAATLAGFARHRADVTVAGVILNRVGGGTHRRTIEAACAPLGIPVLGALPRNAAIALPDRHLGLVQAAEHPGLSAYLAAAGDFVAGHVDVAALSALARPATVAATAPATVLPMPGQRIAVARDVAFAFAYAFVLDGWRAAGAEIHPFSPLADDAPDAAADAIYLPGGYPELHAGRLAANRRFIDGVAAAAARGAVIYGECGGYMVLGRGLVDGDGARHRMAGLLPLESSFARPGLTLGYRRVAVLADGPLGRPGDGFRGHEFHYAKAVAHGGPALFRAFDSTGVDLGLVGHRCGSVMGSFTHLIDRDPA
ncbi:MAG: cobyrinate a,c-diamide synthase [Alphaproteobacteria bacterium]